MLKNTNKQKDKKVEVQIEPYIELIKNYARVTLRKVKKSPWFSYDDLLQEGMVAFLQAKKQYSSEKGASFKTFLIMQLRHHLSDIVKASYRNRESNLDQEKFSEIAARSSENPIEMVHVSHLLGDLTPEELKYIKTMLVLRGEKKYLRRKITRETLGISQNEENRIRNNIDNKITKAKKNSGKVSLLEMTRWLIRERNDRDKVIFTIVTERISRFGDTPIYAEKRAVHYYNYIWNQLKRRKIKK